MKRTRRDKAAELLRLIKRGPGFILDGGKDFPHGEPMTPARMREVWAIWAESWVTPLLADLLAKELAPVAPTADDVAEHMRTRPHETFEQAANALMRAAWQRVERVPHTADELKRGGLS